MNERCYGTMSKQTLMSWVKDLPDDTLLHVECNVVKLGETNESKSKKNKAIRS